MLTGRNRTLSGKPVPDDFNIDDRYSTDGWRISLLRSHLPSTLRSLQYVRLVNYQVSCFRVGFAVVHLLASPARPYHGIPSRPWTLART